MSESTALVDYEALLRKEADEKLSTQLQAPTGNRIKVDTSKLFKMPGSGESSKGPMTCIVLDFGWKNQYFEKAYQQGVIEAPVCYAVNFDPANMAPASDAEKPQSETCKTCKHNQFGSRGRGKACGNRAILAVIPVDATEDSEIMTLEVSATAISRWNNYVNRIKAMHGMPPVVVTTQIDFDPNTAYPSLTFADKGRHKNLPVAMELRKLARDIILQEENAVTDDVPF